VTSVVSDLCLDGREVIAVLEGSAMVEPVDPFRGGDLEIVEALPRPPWFDQFGLVEPDDRLGEGVVVREPDVAGRGLDAGGGEVLGVGHGEVLDSVVVVGDQAGTVAVFAATGPDGLLDRVDDERGAAPPDQVET
jgi:hypothetical protein